MGASLSVEIPEKRREATAWAASKIVRLSTIELSLTAALLFCVVTIVRFAIGHLLVIGALVGLLLALLMRSSLGRASGGHMNPAISLAMWRFGVFPANAVVSYVTAQLLGSLIGAGLGGLVWGSSASEPPVSYAVLQPGAGWNDASLFLGEAIPMGIIVVVVGFAMRARLEVLIPWIVGAMIGLAIVLLGTSTGGSLNPAREFGPAIASGQVRFLWVYLTAPMVGAFVAAAAVARLGPLSFDCARYARSAQDDKC